MKTIEDYREMADFLIERLGEKADVNVLSRISSDGYYNNMHINIYKPGTADKIAEITLEEENAYLIYYGANDVVRELIRDNRI